MQDDYVVQWGHNDDRTLPAGIVARPPAEYERPLAGLAVKTLPYRDSYAPRTGHAAGCPVSLDRDTASPCFATYVVKRANRQDDFYRRPAGGVDICNAPVPVRAMKR